MTASDLSGASKRTTFHYELYEFPNRMVNLGIADAEEALERLKEEVSDGVELEATVGARNHFLLLKGKEQIGVMQMCTVYELKIPRTEACPMLKIVRR